jgi:hypothetical protein
MPVRCSGAPKIVLPPPLGRGQRRLPQFSCTCATPRTRTTEPLATARRQLAIARALLCRCRCRPAHARARHRCHGVAPRAVAFSSLQERHARRASDALVHQRLGLRPQLVQKGVELGGVSPDFAVHQLVQHRAQQMVPRVERAGVLRKAQPDLNFGSAIHVEAQEVVRLGHELCEHAHFPLVLRHDGLRLFCQALDQALRLVSARLLLEVRQRVAAVLGKRVGRHLKKDTRLRASTGPRLWRCAPAPSSTPSEFCVVNGF